MGINYLLKYIIFILILVLPVPALSDAITVITNNSISDTRITREELKEIYMARKTKWESGDRVVVAILKKGEAHDIFTKNIISVPPSKLIGIWKKVIFTGAGYPPKILKTEEDMIKFVSQTKGAVGYIKNSTPHTGVSRLSLYTEE